MKNLFKALAAFQQEVPAIHEGTKGYGYTYSDLKTIFKVINPILAKHNLGFTQLVQGDSIKTIIFHTESGENIETECLMPENVQLKGMNAFQVAGSAITYYRRYSLSAALGLVTDVDSDAKGEEVKELVQMDITEATTKLNNADDLDELETAWKLLTREEKKDKRLIKLAKDLKVEFLKKQVQ
jgi:hypothetical protein